VVLAGGWVLEYVLTSTGRVNSALCTECTAGRSAGEKRCARVGLCQHLYDESLQTIRFVLPLLGKLGLDATGAGTPVLTTNDRSCTALQSYN
jgi:hypothetical protein